MDETTGGVTVRFDHGKTTWVIPEDLLRLQQAWDAAHAAAERAARDGDDGAWNLARAKRLELTLELDRHPWLRAAMAAGQRFQADQALKACAREPR